MQLIQRELDWTCGIPLLTKPRSLSHIPLPQALVWHGMSTCPELPWMTPKLLYGRPSQQNKSKQCHFSISHYHSMLTPAGGSQVPTAPLTLYVPTHVPTLAQCEHFQSASWAFWFSLGNYYNLTPSLTIYLLGLGSVAGAHSQSHGGSFYDFLLFFEAVTFIFLFPLLLGALYWPLRRQVVWVSAHPAFPRQCLYITRKICLIRFLCGCYLWITYSTY